MDTNAMIAIAVALVIVYLWYSGKLNPYLPASLQRAAATSGYCSGYCTGSG